jgi:2,4-diaminopentanoate dehydrogenase
LILKVNYYKSSTIKIFTRFIVIIIHKKRNKKGRRFVINEKLCDIRSKNSIYIFCHMIKIIHYGLGPIGCAMARLSAQRKNLQIVGAVDINPNIIGKDLGEVAGLGKDLGVIVRSSLEEVLESTYADLVVHTTSSYFDLFKNQILAIVEKKLNVVSTAEELSFPWYHHPAEAAEIDNAAKANGVSVLGTGINPGFLLH